jgi:tetratricopeptide (TPR) repeat protein
MRPRFWMTAAVLALLMPGLRAQDARVDIVGLIETYQHGRFDEAVAKAAALPDLGPLRLRFVQDVPLWIQADAAKAEARRAAAAAFLVDLAGARLETDWGRLSDLIEFACAQILRGAGPPTEFERAWHMATHALAGRARARLWLLGEYARLPHQKQVRRPPPQKNAPPTSPMHLMHALERFPDDPHFQLTRVVAWTWGRDAEPMRNLRRRDDVERRMVPSSPQLEALTALKPLTGIPAVAAEAWVRSGLVHLTRGDFAAALGAFETAEPLGAEPAMHYLAIFGAGRALEALARPDDARRKYQRALELMPGAESATVALASLQFMRDERADALQVLDRVFAHTPKGDDPGRMTGYGSYLRWPALQAAMRREVRK